MVKKTAVSVSYGTTPASFCQWSVVSKMFSEMLLWIFSFWFRMFAMSLHDLHNKLSSNRLTLLSVRS